MSVQRKAGTDGKVRYRARVKSNGREVASRMFDRRSDAVAWEQDQRRRLRTGEWLDPRRGQAPLAALAEMWLESRQTVKRRTLESDLGVWRNYIAPRFGRRPVASITAAEVSSMARRLAQARPGPLHGYAGPGDVAIAAVIRGGRRARNGERRGGGKGSNGWTVATRRQVPRPRRSGSTGRSLPGPVRRTGVRTGISGSPVGRAGRPSGRLTG